MTHCKPIPVRLEEALLRSLEEGVRNTPHKKQELIRITLRRYLPKVIQEESERKPRAGWRESFAKVKKEIAAEKHNGDWLNSANEGDKDWQW